ncbi:MAG: hypothetical protein ACE5KL_07575 [Alphaproteobacteria bacterium]
MGNTSVKTLLPHLPYEKGARIVTDILDFVGHRLPRIIAKGSETTSKGLASKELYGRLSELDDAALSKMRLRRAEIPSLVAAKMGIVPFRADRPARSNRSRP